MSESSVNSPPEPSPATADAATASERAGARPAGVSGTWLPLRGRPLALAAGVLVVIVGGALVWQYRAFYAALNEQDRLLIEELELARAGQGELEQGLAALATELDQRDAELQALRAELPALREDLDQVPVELRALERSIDDLQGGRVDARASWLTEQAEYYLVLANSELGLAGRIGTAIEALSQADNVLRTLGDPRFANVRAAIADERQALRAIDEADVEGLVLALANLGAQAGELPLRDLAPGGQADAAVPADEETEASGFDRLWSQTRGAVSSIVRVERQAGPVEQMLTETERQIVRRQLALELMLARVAAIEGRQAELRAALAAVDTVLNRDFDRSAQSVIAVREQLSAMMEVEIEPPLPDISESLRLIRIAAGNR